jgi:hypothetical protein
MMAWWTAALWLGGAVPASAGVVDRVAVVVESELVLDSEILLEDDLARLDRSALPFWEPDHRTAEERLVDAAIIRALVGDLSLYQPSRESVAARLEAVRQQFEDRAAWMGFLQRWGLDEEGLEVILRRRMVVERFFSRNLLADPSDRQAWLDQSEELLEQVRPRVRVRHIAPRDAEVGL